MQFTVNKRFDDAINIFIIDNNDNIEDISNSLKSILDRNNFVKRDDFEFFHYITENENILLIKVKDLNSLTLNEFRLMGFSIAKDLKSRGYNDANISILKTEIIKDFSLLQGLSEGILQSSYSFDDYKTKKDDKFDLNINFVFPNTSYLKDCDFNELYNLIDGINITRELINLPAIDLFPESLAIKAKELLEPLGVKVTIYGKDEIEKMNMTAFLAVARGSSKEPKFIKMEYSPVDNGKIIALVGKGLTYDSGGYALKKPESMVQMHSDMGGAATVIGAIYALAKNNVQQNIVGIVAACENMISGKAYKNGDIVKSMKGTTIEIKNTDAEGRVTLADALYYAATETDACAIIDLATLTGASIIALGEITTTVITNDDFLYKKLQTASEKSGEYIWKLPSFNETRDLLKSKIADITNSTGPFGGAITAGLFLEEFVEKKPWVHLDIAGPSYTTTPYSYIPYGATGIPVKTIYNFVKDY